MILLASSLILAGCSAGNTKDTGDNIPETPAAAAQEITVEKVGPESQPASVESDVTLTDDASENSDLTGDDAEDVQTEDTGSDDQAEGSDGNNAGGHTIVWLGDSLTQGSLGHDNDNLPNAPYEKLKKLANVPVEGYGMYGFNTGDILWTYTEASWMNQERDPNKTYVFWVGSNDWVKDGVANTETADVIARVDDFLNRNGVVLNDYIVLGTTARYELGDSYKVINAALAQHYGKHYLDVIDVIGPDGYGEDRIHLTQAAYDNVAKAVYNKLKALGYI